MTPSSDQTTAPSSAAGSSEDVVERAVDTLLRLAAERPWRELTLLEIAREAGVDFADLYVHAPGKTSLLHPLWARLDRAALDSVGRDEQPLAKDRLFEAFMARLEAMESYRAALTAIARDTGPLIAARMPVTVRALLEASGVDTAGALGALRVAAFTLVWGRVLRVWRDDQGALNRTMAEIDAQIAHTLRSLSRVGAGI